MRHNRTKSALLAEQNTSAKITGGRSMLFELEGVKSGDTLTLRKDVLDEHQQKCPAGTQVVVSRFYQKLGVPRNKDTDKRGRPRGHYVIGFLKTNPLVMVRANLGKFEGHYFKPKK